MPTILVVDDEETIVELLRELLVEEGYLVTTATSTAATLPLVRGGHFDLILSDTMGSRPPDLFAWLGELRSATTDRVLIFSAYPPTSFSGWQEKGYAGVIGKPFDLDALLTTVARLTAKAADAGS